jgi:thioredoxin-related protein
VKLNGEGKQQVNIFGKTMTEAELAHAFQIRGYPSTVFMTEELQPYQPVAGYIPAKEFLRMLKQFNEDS